MYPFPFEVKEEKLQEISSELTELGGYGFTDPEPTAGSETNSRDETESKEECVAANLDSSIISSRKHYVKIDEDDRKRLEPGRYCNDSIVDFWMSWYVFFSFFFFAVFHHRTINLDFFYSKGFQETSHPMKHLTELNSSQLISSVGLQNLV
jgi:hypothetical protein